MGVMCLEFAMIVLRSIAVWLVLILAEALHGIARVTWLEPIVGDLRARQIGVFTGAMLILSIALLFIRWLRVARRWQLVAIGWLWLALTISFEVVLGRSILHYSWERILSDYNLLRGGLLPIGLVILTLSPLIAAKVQKVELS